MSGIETIFATHDAPWDIIEFDAKSKYLREKWLMGFPIGWSGLKDSATPKCRSVPPLRGACCTKESTKNESEVMS